MYLFFSNLALNSNIDLIHYQVALYRKIVTEQTCQVIPFPELPHVIFELI